MKNRVMVMVLSVVFPALIAAFGPTVFANERELVNAPKFTVGDTWEYKTLFGGYTSTIVSADGETYAITLSYEPKARFYQNQHLVIQKVEGDLIRDPRIFIGWKYLDFPMAPKKKFSYRVNGTVATFSIDVEVVKWETIKVPAGTFKALRIESCWRNESSGWYDCGMTHWYSPEAKTFIKRQTPSSWTPVLRNSDFELINFSIK